MRNPALYTALTCAMRKSVESDRWDWRLSVYAAVGAFLAFLACVLYSPEGDFFYLLLVVPAVSLLAFLLFAYCAIRRRFRRCLSVLAMLMVYCAVSWASFRNAQSLRGTIRWALHSKQYKARVLAQPMLSNGELRHLQWDGWGWGGSDTDVYLVYDPQNSLASAARSGRAGHFPGIPCAVPRVRRLQNQWYSVQLYTSAGWGECH